jgi:hypothetical protein
MPFRHEDTSAFGPDDLKTLHEVFERVWERLRAEGYDRDEKSAKTLGFSWLHAS